MIPEGHDLLVGISRLLMAGSDILGGKHISHLEITQERNHLTKREIIKANVFCGELWISIIRIVDIVISANFMGITNSNYGSP